MQITQEHNIPYPQVMTPTLRLCLEDDGAILDTIRQDRKRKHGNGNGRYGAQGGSHSDQKHTREKECRDLAGEKRDHKDFAGPKDTDVFECRIASVRIAPV